MRWFDLWMSTACGVFYNRFLFVLIWKTFEVCLDLWVVPAVKSPILRFSRLIFDVSLLVNVELKPLELTSSPYLSSKLLRWNSSFYAPLNDYWDSPAFRKLIDYSVALVVLGTSLGYNCRYMERRCTDSLSKRWWAEGAIADKWRSWDVFESPSYRDIPLAKFFLGLIVYWPSFYEAISSWECLWWLLVLMPSMALATRPFESAPPIFERLPGVSPARIYSPSLPVGKIFRLLVPMKVLFLWWLLAAEILIRGIAATIWSSFMVLPTDFLNEFRCMFLACIIISVTRVLLYSRAFLASFFDENSLRPQLMPPAVKSIFLSAYLPIGSSYVSIWPNT